MHTDNLTMIQKRVIDGVASGAPVECSKKTVDALIARGVIAHVVDCVPAKKGQRHTYTLAFTDKAARLYAPDPAVDVDGVPDFGPPPPVSDHEYGAVIQAQLLEYVLYRVAHLAFTHQLDHFTVPTVLGALAITDAAVFARTVDEALHELTYVGLLTPVSDGFVVDDRDMAGRVAAGICHLPAISRAGTRAARAAIYAHRVYRLSLADNRISAARLIEAAKKSGYSYGGNLAAWGRNTAVADALAFPGVEPTWERGDRSPNRRVLARDTSALRDYCVVARHDAASQSDAFDAYIPF